MTRGSDSENEDGRYNRPEGRTGSRTTELQYYKVLDLTRSATAEDVRRAYKRMALKWHPDKNLNQKDLAEKMFREITQAYEVLSNDQKRAQYDRLGDAFKITPPIPQFRSPMEVFQEIFGFDFDIILQTLGNDYGGRFFAPFSEASSNRPNPARKQGTNQHKRGNNAYQAGKRHGSGQNNNNNHNNSTNNNNNVNNNKQNKNNENCNNSSSNQNRNESNGIDDSINNWNNRAASSNNNNNNSNKNKYFNSAYFRNKNFPNDTTNNATHSKNENAKFTTGTANANRNGNQRNQSENSSYNRHAGGAEDWTGSRNRAKPCNQSSNNDSEQTKNRPQSGRKRTNFEDLKNIWTEQNFNAFANIHSQKCKPSHFAVTATKFLDGTTVITKRTVENGREVVENFEDGKLISKCINGIAQVLVN